MAVQPYGPDRLTAIELGWRLKEAGYDVDKVEDLGRVLGIDLLEILAGWAPVLVNVLRPPAKQPWWRRLWKWMTLN
jgi:hypothetical protein